MPRYPPNLQSGATQALADPLLFDIRDARTTRLLTAVDGVLLVDASTKPLTVQLPLANQREGRGFCIKKNDSSPNSVLIVPSRATDTIDGEKSVTLKHEYEYVMVAAHAGKWVVLSSGVAYGSGAAGLPEFYLFAGSLGGQPVAGLLLCSWIAVLACTLPAGLPSSEAAAHVAAAGATAYNILVNGVVQGTINWAAGATVATFSWAAAVALAIGDRIDVYAQGTVDASLTDPVWTLRGTVP